MDSRGRELGNSKEMSVLPHKHKPAATEGRDGEFGRLGQPGSQKVP